ncbi:YceD family protein [Bacillus solimangrovi]|uniref:Metal-binding protein n=1 Tax=Bacillus solimangrovi TaxID=1305675 RepID=A0A1E5LIN2_9BACI|nr:DUF177 domain-containing protein [Bacillus solimangrovi]OEH93937.1 hypothetical protein BFG57_10745 [Bacillus solimangrovi]
MKWHVSELNKYRKEGFTFNKTVDVSDLKEFNAEVREVSPVHVTGEVHFAGAKAIFTMQIKGELILPCARSLADVNYPFEIEAREIFSLNSESYSEDTDEDIHEIDGEVLDLTPIIRENILLEIPMQVFSDNPNSEGKAPMSGKGWEVITEEQKEERIDPRLEKLQQFFNKNE